MRILFSRCTDTARGLLPALVRRSAAGVEGAHFGRREKESTVVILGATGTGKSKLSIDIAALFSAEVVNADKIQVYRGLDITTNKMPMVDRRGVPHHLLGELDPAEGVLTSTGFRSLASAAVTGIASRGRIPVVAGGSNSYIHALMAECCDERVNPFDGAPAATRGSLRYRSCLLWVDVEASALAEYLDRRVDEMLRAGMLEELERYFATGEDPSERHPGLGKAIGVPEFREYFQQRTAAAYDEAVAKVKNNTRRLAKDQVRKIEQLGAIGWSLQRLDATPVVAARLAGCSRMAEAEAWERDVMGPSFRSVESFLRDANCSTF
ncbi:hypothetical protein HPP92_022840 [Vanilla planifolia]|uniref:Adenylate isopentenyltransferase n=1 Tax=Vanilla planifolia TaxID=51239 RepID=A0A835PPS4_VANPL|nr:hypothetical protein HPP92_023128 [Vanilla planifolia]KAG0459712.1 hypothetical protein HPP92_022840 [Vanilla planifolia]